MTDPIRRAQQALVASGVGWVVTWIAFVAHTGGPSVPAVNKFAAVGAYIVFGLLITFICTLQAGIPLLVARALPRRGRWARPIALTIGVWYAASLPFSFFSAIEGVEYIAGIVVGAFFSICGGAILWNLIVRGNAAPSAPSTKQAPVSKLPFSDRPVLGSFVFISLLTAVFFLLSYKSPDDAEFASHAPFLAGVVAMGDAVCDCSELADAARAQECMNIAYEKKKPPLPPKRERNSRLEREAFRVGARLVECQKGIHARAKSAGTSTKP